MRRGLLLFIVVAACGGTDESLPVDAPAADAPEIDAPVVDAAVDAPTVDAPEVDASLPALLLETRGQGAGRVTVSGDVTGVCSAGPCSFAAGNGDVVTLRFDAIGASVLGGISGCTLAGDTCSATVAGLTTITATFVPIDAATVPPTWIRTARQPARVADLALTADGVVVTGAAEGGIWVWRHGADGAASGFVDDASARDDAASTIAVLPGGVWMRGADGNPGGIAVTTDGVVVVGERDNQTWIARYSTDGTPGLVSGDPSTAVSSRAVAIAAHPGGGFYVLGETGTARWLRRYAEVGALTWQIATPDARELAVDDAGNVYLVDGGLRSYDPAGALRWMRATTGSASHVSVLGDVVGVAGFVSVNGWVAAYDRGGTLRWAHMIAEPFQSVTDIAVTAAGTIAVLVRNGDLFIRVSYASPKMAPVGPTDFGNGDLDDAQFATGAGGHAVILWRHLADQVDVGVNGTNVTLEGRYGTGAATVGPGGAVYVAGHYYQIPYVPVVFRTLH